MEKKRNIKRGAERHEEVEKQGHGRKKKNGAWGGGGSEAGASRR